MSEPRSFQERQLAFAAHIRDPQHAPAPDDVEDRRMAIYRDLFFNNLNDFLANTLPVLHTLLPAAQWKAMVRDFMIQHRAHSPYFLDIPREFLHYLENERGAHPEDPPFLYELAHYEWVELALSVQEAELPCDDSPEAADLLDSHLQVSPLAWPLHYRFDVQHIRPDYQPSEPPAQPTHLLAYRDRADKVRFIVLNPVSARLLQLFAEHADALHYSGRQALQAIAAELQHPQPDSLLAHGLQQLQDWQTRGILYAFPLSAGTRRDR